MYNSVSNVGSAGSVYSASPVAKIALYETQILVKVAVDERRWIKVYTKLINAHDCTLICSLCDYPAESLYN